MSYIYISLYIIIVYIYTHIQLHTTFIYHAHSLWYNFGSHFLHPPWCQGQHHGRSRSGGRCRQRREERLSGAVHLPPPREARMGASVHATLMGEFWVEIYLDLDPPFVEISGCLTPLMVVLLAFLGGSEGLGMWMNRVGVDRIDPGRYLRSCRVAKPWAWNLPMIWSRARVVC